MPSKWVVERGSALSVANLCADAISSDLRTQNDSLSFWRVESLSDEYLRPVKLVLSLAGSNFAKLTRPFAKY